MSVPPIKKIKEKIKLSACQELDHVYISHKMKSSNWCYLGHVVLLRVKSIGKDRIQIKYRKDSVSSSNVLKAVIPADTIVERTRLWVETDGEDNGYWERQHSFAEVPAIAIPNPEFPIIPPMENIMHIVMGKVLRNISPAMIPTLSSMPDYTDAIGIKPLPEYPMMPVSWGDDFLKALEVIKHDNVPYVVIDSLSETKDFYPK